MGKLDGLKGVSCTQTSKREFLVIEAKRWARIALIRPIKTNLGTLCDRFCAGVSQKDKAFIRWQGETIRRHEKDSRLIKQSTTEIVPR